MHSLILCLSLLGQAPADPGVPWQSEADRQQWIKNMKFQRAFAESQARKNRIARDKATGASLARHYPAFYGDPYAAQRQMLAQQYFANQQLYLQQQRLYGYGYGGYRPRYYYRY